MKVMKRIATLFIMFAGLCLPVYGAVPKLINYQGYLKESGAVVTGAKNITFSLHDALAAGSQLCTSGAQSVAVANGLFSYKLGSAGCDLSLIDWDNPVYLEIDVEGTVLSPREQITGAGYALETKAANVEFAPTGDVAATDVQAAIAEVDAEKVKKSGDAMSGALLLSQGAATATVSVYQTGANDRAGRFEITNAANTWDAVFGKTNGPSGNAVYGENTGSGQGGHFVNTGTGKAGLFEITNAGNSSDVVHANTNGIGTSVWGESTSNTTGRAGVFRINNVNSNGEALLADTNGIGAAATIANYNSSNASSTLNVTTNGTGRAGHFEITNAADNDWTLYATSNGTGPDGGAIRGVSTGTNHGVNGSNSGNGVGVYGSNDGGGFGIYGRTGGTSSAAYFRNDNPANTNQTVYIFNAGTGDYIYTGNGARLSNGGVWTNASSREYKKDINSLTSDQKREMLEKVKDIDVVRFRYKAPGDKKLHIGVIAEDAPDEMTDLKKKGVETSDTDGMLIAAMQAQQEMMESQSARIEAMEAEIARLKAE